METRTPVATPVALINPPQSRRQKAAKYCYYFSNAAIAAASLVSSYSQISYAMSYMWGGADVEPQKVSPSWWWNDLSVGEKIGAAYNGLTTLTLSTAFGCRFTKLARQVIASEYSLFRQRKIRGRFIAETTAALFVALTGGFIAGEPFSYNSGLEWGERLLGFTMVGALGFLGVYSNIIKLVDKSYKFKQIVVEYLKQRLSPQSLEEANKLLNGPLTKENLKEFLTEFFTLAAAKEEQLEHQQDTQPEAAESKQAQPEPFFRQPSLTGKADLLIAGFMAATCTMIYAPGAYQGANIFCFNKLTDIPEWAKTAIGVIIGFPLSSFVLTNFRIFNCPFSDLLKDKKESRKMAKTIGLVTFGIGNSAWYKGLGRSIATNPVLFSYILNTNFGGAPFQYLAMLTALNMGINGVIPLVVDEPDLTNPTVNDVVKCLERDLISSEEVVGALVSHSFFTRNHRPLVEKLALEMKVGEAKEHVQTDVTELKELPKPSMAVVVHVDPTVDLEFVQQVFGR